MLLPLGCEGGMMGEGFRQEDLSPGKWFRGNGGRGVTSNEPRELGSSHFWGLDLILEAPEIPSE